MDASNAKFAAMTEDQWQCAQALEAQIFETLREAFAQGDPAGPLAQKACDLHRQWLRLFWKDGTYSKQAHSCLAQSYVDDARFTAHYDRIAPGCTQFFKDAIDCYCGQ